MDKLNFIEQIKNNRIKVLSEQKIRIENYPYGFKRCVLNAEIVNNRNGVLIHRTTEFNGVVNNPKKTTACCKIVFIYDEDLKHYAIAEHHSSFITILGLNFKSVYSECNFFSCYDFKEYPREEQKHKDYLLINDFLFKDIKRAKGSIISIDMPDKVISVEVV